MELTPVQPPGVARWTPWTVQTMVERVAAGEDTSFALREFLDAVAMVAAEGGDVAGLIATPPPPCEVRLGALAAAVAEHVASTYGLSRPAWVTDPRYFLDRWWFPHDRRAFDALALRSSPAAFRRRGIFIDASSLERV